MNQELVHLRQILETRRTSRSRLGRDSHPLDLLLTTCRVIAYSSIQETRPTKLNQYARARASIIWMPVGRSLYDHITYIIPWAMARAAGSLTIGGLSLGEPLIAVGCERCKNNRGVRRWLWRNFSAYCIIHFRISLLYCTFLTLTRIVTFLFSTQKLYTN